jgi:hypothetical protein
MNATELLMRNVDVIFIELDPVKRGTLLAECCEGECLENPRAPPTPIISSEFSRSKPMKLAGV